MLCNRNLNRNLNYYFSYNRNRNCNQRILMTITHLCYTVIQEKFFKILKQILLLISQF